MKKWIAAGLTMAVALSIVPVGAFAASFAATPVAKMRQESIFDENSPTKGSCGARGASVTWELDRNGTLTFRGSGKMQDYEWLLGKRGWEIKPAWITSAEKIKVVSVEQGVTSIGAWAFNDCSNLRSVVLASGVTSIGADAFSSCQSLESIQIPGSMTEIGEFAFYDCDALTDVYYDGTKKQWKAVQRGDRGNDALLNATIHCTDGDIDIVASGTCGENGKNLTWELDKDGTLTISGSGNMQDYNAWTNRVPWDYYKDNIKTVNVEDGVNYIGYVAFSRCYNLTTVKLGADVKTIGNSAFYMCNSLTEVELPSSLRDLEAYAFSYCEALEHIVIPQGVTEIRDWAFDHCSSLTDITLPSSVTNISGAAFSNCNSLAQIELPAGLTRIENYLFENCSSLTSIRIPAGVDRIGSAAFTGCKSLTSIEIPASVTSIGARAFDGCRNLTDVYYGGTRAQWKAITLDLPSTELSKAAVHF